jgi:putative flippase GtrA
MTRLVRFGLTGALTTTLSYIAFIGLIRLGVHYEVASAGSWALGLVAGFTINRRFTFGISGADRRTRDFSLYVVGSLLQLGLGMTGYAWLIGRLRLDATPAFVLNTAVTATFNFLFLRFVTFRRVDADTLSSDPGIPRRAGEELCIVAAYDGQDETAQDSLRSKGDQQRRENDRQDTVGRPEVP